MITTADLSGFLAMHAGFRTEFGRLAVACAAPRDTAHAALLEEQLALVLDVLHAHHTHEDENLWPFLVDQEPAAADVLAALEAEHDGIDPLIRVIGDTSRPLPERAPALAELHRALNEHLDHEERDAVPLLLVHMTPRMVASDRGKASREIGRRRIPVVYSWVASCLDDAELRAALAGLPAIARLLFRLSWWPSYRSRMERLYGPGVQPPATALSTARPVAVRS